MQLIYHWNADDDAFGPLTPGMAVNLPVWRQNEWEWDEETGEQVPVGPFDWHLTPTLVPDAPDDELWWAFVIEGTGDEEYSRVYDADTKVVTSHRRVPERTLEQAKADKERQIEERATKAMTDGIPVSINGNGLSALLAYERRDRDNWFTWSLNDTLEPDEKFTVRTLTPVNGKYRLALGNTNHLDTGFKAIRQHTNATTAAWDEALDAAEAATTVAEVDAIDVESFAWPENTLPT